MKSRREVLRGGLGIFAAGALGPVVGSASAKDLAKTLGNERPGSVNLDTGTPAGVSLNELKASRPLSAKSFDHKPRMIDGFRFKSWFEGDDFKDDIPFHSEQNSFPGGQPPEPSEEVNVAVIGGGISGMAAAFALREYNPVIFELHDRFGGNAQGGTINGAEFSLGSAYFITPDPNTLLDDFYRDLGLHDVVRTDEIPAPVEINGEINDDIWTGLGVAKEDVPAYEAYRKLVMEMANNYPDVPFSEQWMIDLDRLSLREHIEQEMGMPVPAALAAAIQAYCYASFLGRVGKKSRQRLDGTSWRPKSSEDGCSLGATRGWPTNSGANSAFLIAKTRPMRRIFVQAGGRLILASRPTGDGWSLGLSQTGPTNHCSPKEVVMACAKNIARHIIHDLEADDPELYLAMRLPRRAYLVANVIVDRPIPLDFYDIFLLENPENFPMSQGEAQNFWRYTDVTNGSFTPGPNANNIPRRPSVLTLYWPLPIRKCPFYADFG